jgi:formylglycine-generating enzyme required for sulfatase activity
MRAQFRDCGLADAVPVAALTGMSFYGAEDMAGNAAEWVSDFYDNAYYTRAPAADPPGPLVAPRTSAAAAATTPTPARSAPPPAPPPTTPPPPVSAARATFEGRAQIFWFDG